MSENDQQDWVEDAKYEITGMAKEGLKHPSTGPVLMGSVLGGLAAAFVPLVSLPVGFIAGAGIALYQRIKK